MSESTIIRAEVPIAGFRLPRAREYFETYPCPPPSTVYGMLLSVVGEIDRRQHEGSEIAIALLEEPRISVVLRTMWRMKDRSEGHGLKTNRRPDFQELLTNLRIVVWIRQGVETSKHSLAQRVREALQKPSSVKRFGGLSLGESSHLVNEISLANPSGFGEVLVRCDSGNLSLPVWPDHVGSFTSWEQFELQHTELSAEPSPAAWVTIASPGYSDKL